MEYFTKFLRAGAPIYQKQTNDQLAEFEKSWLFIKNTLQYPDERQLTRGILSTNVPAHLKLIVDALVWESNRTEEGTTGQCLEFLLKNDVLGTLVRLSESDRPFGIQAHVLRAVANMVVLLDEQFLVHSAVHKAVLRLLRACVGDQLDDQLQLDGRPKPMGAASSPVRSNPSEYEEDLVDLLCILCSRIRTYRELLMIFFHDKHWFQSELQTVQEDNEDEEDEDEDEEDTTPEDPTSLPSSPTPSQATITSHPVPASTNKKPEYEFLLFNYLLRFVHREGRIGDFARAGLLFLMDVAMSAGEPTQHTLLDDNSPNTPLSPHSDTTSTTTTTSSDPVADAALALAEYVLDGDFSDVLGAGLGAVYSLLPSKLSVRPDISADLTSTTPMSLGASAGPDDDEKQRIERDRALGLESSSSADFKARLDHFLKLLEFLQDVLRRNVHGPSEPSSTSPSTSLAPSALVGTAIVHSILSAFRTVFLQNILYTSILECSSTDGSAVAVLSYIDIMIRTLATSPLGDVLVDFLMSEDDREETRRPHPRTRTLEDNSNNSVGPPVASTNADKAAAKSRRRKSSAMFLLEQEAPSARTPNAYFTSLGRFTLKDLIFSNLRAPYQSPTAIVAGGVPYESTATAALLLLQTLLTYHPAVCIDKLLIAVRDPEATSFPCPAMVLEAITEQSRVPLSFSDDEDEEFVYPGAESNSEPEKITPIPDARPIFKGPDMTYAMHEREMDMYLALLARVGPSEGEGAKRTRTGRGSFSTGYDRYLSDALLLIQHHTSFRHGIAEDMAHSVVARTTSSAGANMGVGASTMAMTLHHRLDPNDPLLGLLLTSLRSFFSQTPETNIALTGTLAALAQDPYRSLAGWLTFDAAPKKESNEMFDGPRPEESHLSPEMDMDMNDSGDDRSIDSSFSLSPTPSSDLDLRTLPLNESRRPVLYSILLGLVAQLDRYRAQVGKELFDRYLVERRQGLLFSENLNDALSLAIEIGTVDDKGMGMRTGVSGLVSSMSGLMSGAANAMVPSTPPPSRTTSNSNPNPSSSTQSKSKGSSFVSFLTPKKKSTLTPTSTSTSTHLHTPARDRDRLAQSTESTTPPRGKVIAASPFGPHYQETGSIAVQPLVAPLPSVGPWSPARTLRWSAEDEREETSRGWSAATPGESDEDVFTTGAQWGVAQEQEREHEEVGPAVKVTLSQLLDNVVILEESVKELTATIHARRSLGIDGVRYV